MNRAICWMSPGFFGKPHHAQPEGHGSAERQRDIHDGRLCRVQRALVDHRKLARDSGYQYADQQEAQPDQIQHGMQTYSEKFLKSSRAWVTTPASNPDSGR